MVPNVCESCGKPERGYSTGLCRECEASIALEFDIQPIYAGVARLAKSTAGQSTAAVLIGLGEKEKVRRIILANGGLLNNTTEAEQVDADKLRELNPFAALSLNFGKNRQEQAKPAIHKPNPANDQKMAQSGDRWT